MGVKCSAMTYVGKYVEDGEAYLIERGILKEGQAELEFGRDFNYAFTKGWIPLCVQEVSCYSDEGAYVGFEVSPSDYKNFDPLIAKFKEITGDDATVESFEQWW